jgi:hypothetical protein
LTDIPFAGLFRTDTRHGARVFEGGFRWDFDKADLNESARAVFHHLDRVFEVLYAPAFAFLSTIELDADAGRFPDVLAQDFRDDAWSDTHSFRVLAQNGGFRWGASLRVWGIQVPKVEISRNEVVRGSRSLDRRFSLVICAECFLATTYVGLCGWQF